MLADFKNFLFGVLSSTLLRLINLTLRWETIGLDNEDRFWPYREPRILSFWHGHQLLMPWIYKNGLRKEPCGRMYALISQHQDGRMIAKAMDFLGIDSIAGSSSRRGLGAMYDLIDCLKAGNHISITPDGPRGPKHKVKGGIFRIAQRTGAKIYPTAIVAEKKWTSRSWDGMFLPKPFSRAVMIMGEPLSVPSELSNDELERMMSVLEEAMGETIALAESKLLFTRESEKPNYKTSSPQS